MSFTYIVVIPSIVTLFLQSFNLINRHTKNKDVLGSHLFHHFNIGTIQSSNGQSSIQLKKKWSDVKLSVLKFQYCMKCQNA